MCYQFLVSYMKNACTLAFFKKYKILFKKQFGFRKNHYTIYALINLVDLITKHLDNDYLNCGIFIDLQRPFDTVNHDILLAKRDHFCVRGLANNRLGSFLKNRTQHVYFYGHCSITKQFTCGVQQGAILGPLLFLVYINNSQDPFSKSILHHFADDTNLFPAKNLALLNLGSVMN